MVIVNTVVLVQSVFGLDQQSTAIALAAFGGGSMLAAFALPKLLDQYADRAIMLIGAGTLVVTYHVIVFFVAGSGRSAMAPVRQQKLGRSIAPCTPRQGRMRR